MEECKIIKADYQETFIRILIAEVNWLLAYWSISDEYNNSFIEKFGKDFFEKTKEILKIKNLSNNTEEIIEVKEPTNNYYIKFNYSDSIYQVELIRLGIENDEDYGYKIESNIIHSPNIKIRINDYDKSLIKFKNIKTGRKGDKSKSFNTKDFSKENIQKLYDDTMRPSWNAYKKENGYKEK